MRVVRWLICCLFLTYETSAAATDLSSAVRAHLESIFSEVNELYVDLHRNPELSLQEEKTAAKLAERLRGLGFEVTSRVGGHGIVGVLRNGAGPTLMIRTDMDALPVEEKTGLPYTSLVRTKDASGRDVPVMHACGHDVHMASWIGTASILSHLKNQWRGTLMMVGQPAEESLEGAKAMISAGLFTRFPKPDRVLAIHGHAFIPAGAVGVTSGYCLAGADSIDVTIFGRGGHGANPHTTIDPIVIAARVVLALQTIVAREKDPFEPAVVTVGSIHGGTRHNIIPDEVQLQLTVRTLNPDLRNRILSSIQRIVDAEADAAAAPKPPLVTVTEGVKPTYNDPTLTSRTMAVMRTTLGEKNVMEMPQRMASEDFSEFIAAGVPGFMLWVGTVDPAKFQASLAGGPPLPSAHSPLFAPDRERTLRTAILAETLAALELLKRD